MGRLGPPPTVRVMTNFTPHLIRRSRRCGAALLLAALVALAPCTPVVHTANAAAESFHAYGWPVAPFDRQHPIRGGFGDPRTLFNAPPTNEALYHGPGQFTFHEGVDISAPDGTAVYPVEDGVVSAVDTAHDAERVVVDSAGVRFEYWHIAATVRAGQQVTTDRTVLGHILRGAGHVHLTEVDGGRITDPLLPGHLTPYRDHTAPEIASIQLKTADDAAPAMPNFIRGSVGLYAEAYDMPALPVPGAWHGMPITPAVLAYRIETWNGKVVVPERTVWDTRETIPSNATFWAHYARGTFQNMSVFGGHYSWGQPGCFVFRLGMLNTRTLPDNVYRLVVTVRDVRGNTSSSSLRFSIHNRSGWAGV
jgi:Peptidase family M23